MECKDFFEQAREVYSWMEDEQSKRIFESRFAFSGTQNDRAMCTLIQESSPAIQKNAALFQCSIYDASFSQGETVIIYGAGSVGQRHGKKLEQSHNCHIIFCDKNYEALQGNFPYEVISLETLSTQHKDKKVIVTASFYTKEVCEDLGKVGIPRENMILGATATLEEQYFDPIITFGEEEVFVDCGTFDGQTSALFATLCPNYKKIICFEPDIINLEKAKERFREESLEHVEIIHAGVWDKKDILRFSLGHGVSSGMSDVGEVEVPVESIDAVLKGDSATFIKMDVESAELKALQGAKETILKYKPKLAISIYHKHEDILEIPAYIKSLVPEYKFYLRHYTSIEDDTILYGVVKGVSNEMDK